MHGFEEAGPAKPDDPNDNRPWYKLLTRYHWFVLIVAALGWLFDCLDQQLFILARPQAMAELLQHLKPDPVAFKFWTQTGGDIATSVFIAGWATGGLIFGMLGDRIGRARTMVITILLYSLCTGLSSLSQTVYDFAFYRFLTGLGVGGEFAVGVALVAEVMPSKARPFALSLLQALSAFGNISAALINWQLGLMEGEGLESISFLPSFLATPWRIMFLIGALPALLALVIRRRLKEPEQWEKASKGGVVEKQLGSYSELFSHPVWRKHALFGLMLACSGVIGLWAVGFYTPDLIRQVQTKPLTEAVYQREIAAAKAASDATRVQNLETIHQLWVANKEAETPTDLLDIKKIIDAEVRRDLTKYQSLTSIAINIGAFCGMFGFGYLSHFIGRKPTFAIALLAAFGTTIYVFLTLQHMWQIFVLVPIMGFCQLSLFGGYAIYFPELFPTRLRSTGTSFCYNVGRFVAALGPVVKIGLNALFANYDEPLRYAGATMCAVFLIGLFALPFLPETNGKPLPE
ncbi:Putative niacin/nicotinamide transporter NaiP [Anatilimnocola aggregata]|uniref:Niacin/nicotinamide transporter NaiP n=1 Tax=Anatilimnocola aggregata TaxID=2528021 RepID=A0A517YH95_9BACT|nr:MFS transporter [Anatilimnocola aggregata]QDU29600.1 Putative niacin/nicotinamide transporter NaiP [Anatilimnocola aggregata]